MIRCPHCKEQISMPLCHKQMFKFVMTTMNKCNWVRKDSAKKLGISERTLQGWLQRYWILGVEFPRQKIINVKAWVDSVIGDKDDW